LRTKLDGSAGKGPNSARLAELRAELDTIKEYFLPRTRKYVCLCGGDGMSVDGVENKRH